MNKTQKVLCRQQHLFLLMSISFLRFSVSTVVLQTVHLHSFLHMYFTAKQKEGTGRTFLQIIRDIKLNQACRALRETSLSNAAICELVGYDSPEHFMHTFKKAYNMTPGEYRKKCK